MTTQQTQPVSDSMATGSLLLDGTVRIPADIYNLTAFCNWVRSEEYPDRGDFSFLAGEVFVDMSPEELHTHNKVKNDIGYFVTGWVRQHDIGEVLADGAWLVNHDAGLSTEPDLTFCSWDRLQSGRVKYVEVAEGSDRYVEVAGSPDLVVEIVSRSSVHKDTKLLPPLYFSAGVSEFWLIDARDGDIAFRLFKRGAVDWIETTPDHEGYYRSDVLGGSFCLTRGVNRVGGAKYELLSKVE